MRRRRSLATVLALALAGCATGGGTPRPALTQAQVGDWARLLQMSDARRLDTALLERLLRSRSSALRVAAARAAGQVHGAAMAPSLRALLGDRDTAAAGTAAFALGLLHDSASVPALARALDAPPTVAREAAWALGEIGEPARATIVGALARGARPRSDVGALLRAVAKLRPVPLEPVLPYLSSDSASVRWSAAYAIARPNVPAGVRPMLGHVADPDPEVRALVARALGHAAAGDSLGALAVPALERLARDADPHVRINALRALATHEAGRDAIVAATRDPDANVRITAAQSLRAVLDSRRRDWLDAWAADTAFAYRRVLVASALARDVVLDPIDEDNPDGWAHDPDWRHRAAVADAADGLRVDRIRETALFNSRDPDPRVRAAAYGAFAPKVDSAEHHPWRRELMYGVLEDWDFAVRATAIGSLAGHATAAEVPLVLRAYRLSLEKDSVPDAQIAAVRFFDAAWHRDSASFPDSLVGQLRALPPPANPLVRAAGEGASLFAAWRAAPPAPDPHPLAWYEQRVRELVLPALAGRLPRARLETERGPVELELFALDAPLTVDNFIALARRGYYDGLRFHRVVPNFVVQDGDHRGDGNGGPAYQIRDELNRRRYDRGVVGMALSGPDTGGSQYFITLSPQPHLDGGYTVFGRVVSGFDALDALVQGDLIRAVVVH